MVAAVAARTPKSRRSRSTHRVEYEVLPSLVDFDANAAADSPLVHEEWSKYEADESVGLTGNIMGHSSIVKGDATLRWPSADVVVKSRYVADASQGAPIEPRAISAEWHGDKVTVWSSTQVPFAAGPAWRTLSNL